MFRIIGETKFKFIEKRKYTVVLSAILVALGITGLIMIGTGNANMGIDFAGGLSLRGHFASEMPIESLRSAVTAEFPDAAVTEVNDPAQPHSFIIKVKRPETEAQGEEQAERILALLASTFSDNAFTSDSEHIIGPAVGEQLRKDAQLAILLSLIGVLIYIAFRFDFRSGVAATVATFHDVLAVIGIFWVLGLEFDLLIVTALLTLAGYSLSDTVVVFDRIRENLRRFRTKGEFGNAINLSINETLARTINTSLTVLLVVVTLFIFGGEVLKYFALALIIGVLVGSYSSVFVASPLVYEWEMRKPARFKV